MNISIIIPTYNRALFIETTLASVFNQSYQNFEIIVVDDGSTDNTKEILQKFKLNYKNIKYIYQKNQGVSSARNKGIKNSSFEWICFLDSDDIWEDQKLQEQVDFHKANPSTLFSHTDELWLFNDKIIKQKKHHQKPKGFCFEQNIANTLIGCSTVMIHRSIFDAIGYFDESLTACEDYDLWLRILREYQLGFVNKKLIKKIAGHKGQLSFETPLMDSYRIKALQKHINSKHQESVKKEIIKKSEILIKGAIKHNNKKVKEYYTKLLANL